MKLSDVRNWLGIYFLLITSILGGYILLFKETMLFPLEENEAMNSFEIIIPVLVGQLTIIFQWFGKNRKISKDRIIDIPTWAVKYPPIIVLVIILVAILNLIIGNIGNGQQWVMNPNSFKLIVTFCVTILNATTVFIIARLFK